jgi:hypothetical protein
MYYQEALFESQFRSLPLLQYARAVGHILRIRSDILVRLEGGFISKSIDKAAYFRNLSIRRSSSMIYIAPQKRL